MISSWLGSHVAAWPQLVALEGKIKVHFLTSVYIQGTVPLTISQLCSNSTGFTHDVTIHINSNIASQCLPCTCTFYCIAALVTDSPTTTDVDAQCDANARLVSGRGIGKCVCNPGYEGNGFNCEGRHSYIYYYATNYCEFLCQQDIDECTTGNDNCHPQARCCNVEGSFVCICNKGFTGDGVECCRRSNMIAFINRTKSISKSTHKRKHKTFSINLNFNIKVVQVKQKRVVEQG